MKFLRTLFNRGHEPEDTISSLEEEMRQLMRNQSPNDESLETEMQQLLNGPGPDEFYAAMVNLQKHGEIALPPLKAVITDSNQPSGFRARALETVAMIGGKDIGAFLMQCATDSEFQVRWSAVSMLGELRIREALPLLKQLHNSDHTELEFQSGFVLSMNKAVTEAISSIENGSK